MSLRRFLAPSLLILITISVLVTWVQIYNTSSSGTVIAALIRSGALSESDIRAVRSAIDSLQQPTYHLITVRYVRDEPVYWPPTWNITIVKATYGYGDLDSDCLRRYKAWGTPGLIYCKENHTTCTGSKEVDVRITGSTFKIAPPYVPTSGNCPRNKEILELSILVPAEPPNCNTLFTCNGKGMATVVLTVKGMYCDCVCEFGFAGATCKKCETGFYNWPDCFAEPFIMDAVKHKKTHPGSTCPDTLLEHRCDNSKIPRPLQHQSAGPSFLSVLGCGIASLPWECEIGAPNTIPIESISTIATREFVGEHLLILLESLAIFAPTIPVYVGVDSDETSDRLSEAFSEHKRFQMVRLLVLTKCTKLAYWYQEKPQVMKHALKSHRTTLWLDSDAFLVNELPKMPDSPMATFGCGVHDPRGWGTAVLPHRNGFTNTGVIFARDDTLHLNAWNASMIRHDQVYQSVEYFKGQEQLYLDQGPMDVSLTNTKGAFKLQPQWNVAWWTPDARLEDWRPHWWVSDRNFGNRISLDTTNSMLLLDNIPVIVVHSHFVKEEKNYGKTDSYFNTLIFNLLNEAIPGSKLSKMAKRLNRYASHLNVPNNESIATRKLTWEFLETIVLDWNDSQ